MNSGRAQPGYGVISPQESLVFAQLSGDFNPLHLDPVTARRFPFGSTLVHGINGTLRALDIFFSRRGRASLSSLQVTFNRPARQGDELEFAIDHPAPSIFRIAVSHRQKKVQTIEFALTDDHEADSQSHRALPTVTADQPGPDEISMERAQGLAGSVPLCWDAGSFSSLFPQLAGKLPAGQCATIMATSRIVGMNCPGLHSLYARLNLEFARDCGEPLTQLHYRVESVDARFSRVVMQVFNGAASGSIEAFFRPAPVAQASAAAIASLVGKDRFSGRHALVVGGSRGLGEVTAKLLSAGGATTILTWASGRDDADRVAREIVATGGSCQALRLNVLDDEFPELLLALPQRLTHIYYMASPLIEKSGAQAWDSALFARYSDFYIGGLARLLAFFAGDALYRAAPLSVYAPSTIFLDSPDKGFPEYTACKAAAESFAAQMRVRYPGWQFTTPRLPRMLTDQTSGIAGMDTLDNARTMLASLGET